jgi:uncharacterized protein YjbI with pentapeptide repeats
MVNEEQFNILMKGADAWNEWRKTNPGERIDLRDADLRKKNLEHVNFNDAYLHSANLNEAYLGRAELNRAIFDRGDLGGADLHGSAIECASFDWTYLGNADLSESTLSKSSFFNANLGGANLRGSILKSVNFNWANLNSANLSRTDLHNASLFMADLAGTNLEGANIIGCMVYGISAWKLKLNGSTQRDLIITEPWETIITVDNLEVAQFIYLLLHNEKIRHVIDTITSKVVLILGRFTSDRKAVLDGIRDELRRRDYLPVLFDFDKPTNRDRTETISTLAHMARFIIADITEAKSIPAELQCIVPNLPSVPVIPMVLRSDQGYALFDHIRKYNSVLEPYEYENQIEIIASIGEKIIGPAEAKVVELRKNACSVHSI